jgi:hypothetical protein
MVNHIVTLERPFKGGQIQDVSQDHGLARAKAGGWPGIQNADLMAGIGQSIRHMAPQET